MVDHIVPEVNSDEGNCRSNILLVDSDESSLFSLTKVLEQCNYGAVACKDSDECLATIREKKERFVFAIIDVSIPTIGGYQLCKLVRLETDIPVLLMSSTYSNAETMQKVQDHGAIDFLLKPIKAEDVSKINLNARQSRSLSKSRNEWICTEEERASLAISDEPNHVGNDVSKKKRKGESVPEIQPLGRKKPRLIWTSELHKQFLEVVNELGVHKAVPKKIMEKMNNPELTRENIASHLQKYRHYVKKQKGELHQQPQTKSLPPQQEQHEILSNEAPTSNCDVLNTPCIQAVASAGPTLKQDFQAPHEDTTTNYLMDQAHPLPVQMVHDPRPQLPNEINGSSKPPMDIMPQHEAACFSCYVDGQCLTIFEPEYNIHSDRWMQQNHKGQSSSVNFNSINASNPYQLDDNSFNNPNCRVDRDSQPIFSSGNNQVAHSEPMIYSMYDQGAHSQPMTNGVHVQGRLPTSQSNQPDKVNSVTQR